MAEDDRTIDAAVLHGPTGGRRRIALLDERGGSAAVAGPEKLAQRVILEFLTPLGSMPMLPHRGSTFLDAVARGGVRTDLDARQEFALAMGRVGRNLAADERPDDPDDERLAAVELNRVVVADGRLILDVEIRTVAGSAATAAVPIRTGT